MSRDADPTIAELARYGRRLRASCGACGHTAEIDPRSLPPRFQALAADALRLRCGRCGARVVGAEPVRRPPLPPNPQRVADLYAHGHYLGGLCATCRPVRGVDFTLGEIEAQLGQRDPLVRDAARRLACPHCRAPILTSVGSISAGNTNARRA